MATNVEISPRKKLAAAGLDTTSISRKLSGRVSSRDVSFKQEALAVPDSNLAAQEATGGDRAGRSKSVNVPRSGGKKRISWLSQNAGVEENEPDNFFSFSASTRKSRRKQIRQDLSHPPDNSGIGGVIIASFPFQLFMGICIASNAAIIGLETDDPSFGLWEYAELLFLLVFSLEFLLRLRVFGVQGYFSMRNPDFMWNAFDAGIVISGVLGTTLEHLHLIAAHRSHGFATLLRVIRLFRVFRIIRLVRMLKQLYMLIFGFGIAAIATVWVTILFLVLLYVFAVVAVKLRATIPDSDIEIWIFLNERFCTVPVAMFFLFDLMVNPDLTPYEELLESSRCYSVLIIIFVIFGSFGMMALLTGIITEAMFDQNSMRLEQERTEREQRRRVLNELCASMFETLLADDKSFVQRGSLPSNKKPAVKKCTQELSMGILRNNVKGMSEVFQKQGFHFARHDLVEVLDYVDFDGSSSISLKEFTHAICSISEGVQASTVMELHKSVGKRTAEVEREVADVMKAANVRSERLSKNLECIREVYEGLETQVNRLLTLVGIDPDTIAIEGEAGQASSGGQSSSASGNRCQTCLTESAEDTRLNLQVDAFEPALRQMQNMVRRLCLQKSRAPEESARPPGGSATFGDSASAQQVDPAAFSRSAMLSESWDAMLFEVPLDPLLDQALESASSADLFFWDSTSTARSWPISEDSCFAQVGPLVLQ